MHSGVVRRVQETSISRVPAWTRRHWPHDKLHTTADSQAMSLNRSVGLELSLCFDTSKGPLAIADGGAGHNFDNVLSYFSHVRDVSLALLKIACVGENVALGGGAVAVATLTGLNTLPNEAVRRRAVYSICPVLANSSQGLREVAAWTIQQGPWANTVRVLKSLQSSQVICIRR